MFEMLASLPIQKPQTFSFIYIWLYYVLAQMTLSLHIFDLPLILAPHIKLPKFGVR